MKDLNILIVTHGLTLRLFLMRYFQLTVEEFETTWNPPNGQVIVMERFQSEAYGWEYYRLHQESAAVLHLEGNNVSSEDPNIYRERYNL
jgi:broad specificity phosphatase PhoE